MTKIKQPFRKSKDFIYIKRKDGKDGFTHNVGARRLKPKRKK